MTETLDDKLDRIEKGLNNDGTALRDLAIRIWSNIWGVGYVGALKGEDQKPFIDRINRARRKRGLKEWKYTYPTLVDSWVLGIGGTIEHTAEGFFTPNLAEKLENTPIAFISNTFGISVQAVFYAWAAWNLGQTAYRIYYSSGKNGEPIASFSPKGLAVNLSNYFYKKRQKKKACGLK